MGAIFNGALEFGSAIGLAAFNSIQTSVEATQGGTQAYSGRAAAFWFLLGLVLIEILSLLYFYQRKTDDGPQPNEHSKNYAARDSEERSSEADKVNSGTLMTKEKLPV